MDLSTIVTKECELSELKVDKRLGLHVIWFIELEWMTYLEKEEIKQVLGLLKSIKIVKCLMMI